MINLFKKSDKGPDWNSPEHPRFKEAREELHETRAQEQLLLNSAAFIVPEGLKKNAYWSPNLECDYVVTNGEDFVEWCHLELYRLERARETFEPGKSMAIDGYDITEIDEHGLTHETYEAIKGAVLWGAPLKSICKLSKYALRTVERYSSRIKEAQIRRLNDELTMSQTPLDQTPLEEGKEE